MQKLQGTFLALCLIASTMANPTPTSDDTALRAVSESNNLFSSEMFWTIAEQNKGGNLITSPLSVGLVLAMAAAGARGETEKQFKTVLHLPEDEAVVRTGYQNIIDKLNTVKDVELNIANKIFATEKFPVKPTFKELTETYFRSASQSVDFAKSVDAANTINSWVEQQTNSRIKDIVKADDLDASTALVLVNAVYFKGQWKKKFNPELTKDLPFHVNSKTVKNVPTMYKLDNFKYGELPEMKARYVEIPYKGDELSMVIILPDDVEGLPEVERHLKTVGLKTILNSGYEREVQLYLPKFKIESKIDLEDKLQAMGLTDMFSPSANFTGIADLPLKVSKVVQKAFIEVNEEGSEAAAATGLHVVTYSLSLPDELMMIDRPFIYVIARVTQNQETGSHDATTLFSGHVYDPQT